MSVSARLKPLDRRRFSTLRLRQYASTILSSFGKLVWCNALVAGEAAALTFSLPLPISCHKANLRYI